MRRLLILVALSLVAGTAACRAPAGKETATPAAYPTRSSEGDISFRLTPRPWTAGRLILDVQADTHSGDLAELTWRDVMTLQVGSHVYRPVEATAFSGHHAQGSVTFDVPEAPDRFAVTMSGIRRMDALRFEWP